MLDIKLSNIKMLHTHFAKSDLINRLIKGAVRPELWELSVAF